MNQMSVMLLLDSPTRQLYMVTSQVMGPYKLEVYNTDENILQHVRLSAQFLHIT